MADILNATVMFDYIQILYPDSLTEEEKTKIDNEFYSKYLSFCSEFKTVMDNVDEIEFLDYESGFKSQVIVLSIIHDLYNIFMDYEKELVVKNSILGILITYENSFYGILEKCIKFFNNTNKKNILESNIIKQHISKFTNTCFEYSMNKNENFYN